MSNPRPPVIRSDYVDPFFAPQIIGESKAAAQQADGKILIGGNFTQVNDVRVNDLVRFNVDGTLDRSFKFDSGVTSTNTSATAGYILAILILPDGKIMIGGEFDHVGAFETLNLARLHPDGSLDTTFRVDRNAISRFWMWELVNAMEHEEDGSVVAAELHRDAVEGTVLSFQPNGIIGTARPNNHFIRRQSTGKIIKYFIGLVNGVSAEFFERINPDGRRDPTFIAPSNYNADRFYPNYKVLPDDMIVFTGYVPHTNGVSHGVFRLLPDGQPEPTFYLEISPVAANQQLFPLPDGSIVLIGRFDTISGLSRNNIARIFSGPVGPPIIVREPSDLRSTAGRTVQFEVEAGSYIQPSYQWKFQGNTISGATNKVLEFSNVQAHHVGHYQVEVSNSRGKVLSSPALLSLTSMLPGAVDPSFGTEAGPNGTVYALVKQTDGKWIIGGNFAALEGASRPGVARLLPNGALDASFNPGSGISGGTNTRVAAIAVQTDGQILIGGKFTQVQGAQLPSLARLNMDGSLDESFLPTPQTNLTVYVIKPDFSGRILVGGDFSYRTNQIGFDELVRLEMDGSLDETFKPGIYGMLCHYITCVDISYVLEITLRRDGTILTAGGFGGGSSSSSRYSRSVMRLNSSGIVDSGFNSRLASPWGIGTPLDIPPLTAMEQQPDGKVVIAGPFSFFGQGHQIDPIERHIARLNTDGSRDTSFPLDTAVSGPIHTIAVDSDGRILIGGAFQSVNAVKRMNIARLSSTGQLDTSFDPGSGPNGAVHKIIPMEDGSIMIAGAFTEVDGLKRPGVARLFGEDRSIPQIKLSTTQSGALVLKWQTLAGRRYLLESTGSLAASAQWTKRWEAAGDNQPKEFKEDFQPTTQRFYRLRVE